MRIVCELECKPNEIMHSVAYAISEGWVPVLLMH